MKSKNAQNTNKIMKTAYSYVRWSHVASGEEAAGSKARQTESANNWIQHFGNGQYVLSHDVFIDAAKSASKGKHLAKDEYGKAKGSLARFIEAVEDGKIKNDSILLVDDFSRFSRLAPAQAMELFSSVLNSGIGLVFTGSHEKRVIDSALLAKEPHILYFITSEMIRSYSESAEKSRKIKSGLENMRQQIANGIVRKSHLPEYFTFIPNEPLNPKCKIGKYVHNENTKVVKEMCDLLLQGISMRRIAVILNKRGIKTFKENKQWQRVTVFRVLSNRLLIGEWLGVKNFVPPIVSEDEFLRIKHAINNCQSNKGRNAKHKENIFRGICFCHACGQTMSVLTYPNKNNPNKPFRYLRCSSIEKGKLCKNQRNIRLDEMELDLFTNYLSKTPAELLAKDNQKLIADLSQTMNRNEGRIAEISEEVKKYISIQIKTGEVEEISNAIKALNSEREKLKAEIDDLKSKIAVTKNLSGKSDFDKLMGSLEFDDEGNVDISRLMKTEEKIADMLANNELRPKLREAIAACVGKITVNAIEKDYYVYNRSGKMVYSWLGDLYE